MWDQAILLPLLYIAAAVAVEGFGSPSLGPTHEGLIFFATPNEANPAPEPAFDP